MVPLKKNSPLGLSRTFRTPLKGDVLSCPAIHPSYGMTFCDIVRPCPVVSGRQNGILKFYIKSQIKPLPLNGAERSILSVFASVLRPRQIPVSYHFIYATSSWRAEKFLNLKLSWDVRFIDSFALILFSALRMLKTCV